MKKFKVYLCLLVASGVLLGGCGGSETENVTDSGNTLVVFNYGDYIDFSTIEMFEKETGIRVEYEQYVTPEDMYTKYQSGNIPYDLICTSDYMVEKMIRNGEAKKIDTDSMEYYDNLDPTYLEFCQAFDAENEYAVPYFWGTVGILYNTELVDEEVDSWDILWNEKYENQIIMENSMRDAFEVPLKWRGKSLNTTDEEELREAQAMLMDQKKLVMAYMVDESRDAMIAGDAALAVIYSGDATAAMEANENLDYVVPEEGSNIWFDCWMIPHSCKHQENAHIFMLFIFGVDIARINFDYVYYGTPNKAVYDGLDEETKEDYTIFPEDDTLEKCEVYKYLGSERECFKQQCGNQLYAY